jgi:polyhydroxybutyrate depolymerase
LTARALPRYRVPVKPRALLLCLLLSLAGVPTAGAQGNSTHTLVHQGLERRIVLHTPSAAGATGPRPLVLVLHGSGQPPQELRDWLPMEPIADREGFVVAYPDAIDGKWNYGERADETIDDLGFIGALLEQLVARGIADPERLYVAGISRGALMTWTLLCRQPGRFAAAAALSSGMTEVHLGSCAPSQLIPILAIAGTADSVQPYDGSADPARTPRLLSIPRRWSSGAACTIAPTKRCSRCRTASTAPPLPHIASAGRPACAAGRSRSSASPAASTSRPRGAAARTSTRPRRSGRFFREAGPTAK